MPHIHDVGKQRLRTLVDGAAEAGPRLPLVHSTDSYVLEDVLTAKQLEPQPCNVFGENLTYLFYGRPAFRPNNDAAPTSLSHYFPVCLILRPGWAIAIKRIYPFDSGAFIQGFYENYLHKAMRLADFGLEPDSATPGKLIGGFFGSVPAYLTGKPGAAPTLDPSEFEAFSYHALISAQESNAIDSRGSGVEIQTGAPLPIAESVAAVVLPSTFADGATGQALNALGVDLLPYRVVSRSRPSEYMSMITDICFNYYIRMGLISEADL